MITNNKLSATTKLIFILIISLILRLISIGQSLWLDEAISANVIRLNTVDIITNFSIHDFHPPLYYLLLRGWTGLAGNGVFSLRLLSIIFSLVTIWVVYLIGKKIKNKNLGLWAAIFTGFNPLFVYFSQEVRMYSLVTMCLTLVLLYFIKIIKNKKNNSLNIFWFNFWSFFSFFSFYGSIFLLAAFGLYFLINKKIKLLLLTNIGILLAIAILSPLLLIQITNSRTMLQTVVNWDLVLGKANLKDLLLILLKFSSGRISFLPKYLYYLVSGIWATIVFAIAIWGTRKNKLLGFLFVVPIILGFVFSLWSPLLQYFRFLYLIPILGLLLALGIKKDSLKLVAGGIFLIFSLIYLLNPIFHREDWKSLSNSLSTNSSIYIIDSFADPIKYYRKDIKIIDLKTINPTAKEITVVPYGEIIHGLNHFVKLEGLGYKKISERSFREITLEEWTLEKP
ncbi:MAG: glycosyltransferase family 39 protein [Candidatus Margulisiibacteriota bacterium]|jgi:uncharacterized membrane protein